MQVINGTLYFFLDSGILRLFGSTPDNFSFQVVSDSLGLISPRSLFPFQDGVCGMSARGPFVFNGQDLRVLGQAAVTDLMSASRGSMDFSQSCMAVNGDFIYLSYRDDSEKKMSGVQGNSPNRTLVINTLNDRVGVVDDWAFSQSTPLDGGRSVVFGGYNTLTSGSTGTGTGGGGVPGYFLVQMIIMGVPDDGASDQAKIVLTGVVGYPVYRGVRGVSMTTYNVWIPAGASPALTFTPALNYRNDQIYVDGVLYYDWNRDHPAGPGVKTFASLAANHYITYTVAAP
jgi:hypothetical protein